MCSMKGKLRVRERAYADPVLDTLVELNGTVDQREQRVVLATANVLTRVDVSAVLTDENRARGYRLAGIALRAKALTAGVTAITGGTESFFVCHCVYLLFRYECNLLGDGSLGNSLGLCLDSLLGAGRSLDLHDLQLGELLTVTLQTTIALTLVELEDQLLLALELLNDLSGNLGLGQLVGIGDDLLTIVEEDDRQGDLVALIALDLLDGDDIVGGDLVLLAARVNDCVHVYLPFMHQLVQQPNIVAGENTPVNEYVEQIHKFAQVWG